MLDVKANFKTKYQGILLHCPFCKIDEESLEHIFVRPDGLICKFSDNVSWPSGQPYEPEGHWTTTETGLVFVEIR